MEGQESCSEFVTISPVGIWGFGRAGSTVPTDVDNVAQAAAMGIESTLGGVSTHTSARVSAFNKKSNGVLHK